MSSYFLDLGSRGSNRWTKTHEDHKISPLCWHQTISISDLGTETWHDKSVDWSMSTVDLSCRSRPGSKRLRNVPQPIACLIIGFPARFLDPHCLQTKEILLTEWSCPRLTHSQNCARRSVSKSSRYVSVGKTCTSEGNIRNSGFHPNRPWKYLLVTRYGNTAIFQVWQRPPRFLFRDNFTDTCQSYSPRQDE